MGTTRLSRTAAIVVMTSALAWNLPVLAQEDIDDAGSVTLISGADAADALDASDEILRAAAQANKTEKQ